MNNLAKAAVVTVALASGYTIFGTQGDIEYIKAEAPKQMQERGWEIVRYEGWQRGSWAKHGGKVWYHVKNVNNDNIQYRVHVAEWGGELHYYYNKPEVLSRIDVKVD